MSSGNERPQVGDQHVAESDDFMKLTPINRLIREVKNSSPGQNLDETTLQSPFPRPWGHPATKCPSVERGCSDETTCTVEKKPSTAKGGMAKRRHVAKKYYVMLKTPMTEKIMLQDYTCNKEETQATVKRASVENHQSNKQLSGKRHRVSEKSRSFEKHLSVEKHLPTMSDYLNRKRQFTENGCSTEEGGFGGRDYYGERGRPVERCQPTEKSTSPKKGYLDGKGPCTENHHLQKNGCSAKRLSCTERDHQIEGDGSVKRGLSTEKGHPVGRGRPHTKSHRAEGYSAIKSPSAEGGCPIKSRPAEEGSSVDLVNWPWSRPFASESIPTEQGCHIRSRPAVVSFFLERDYTLKKRHSTGKDHPIWRSLPQKKSSTAEEGQSADRGNSARQNCPTRRGRLPKKIHCAEKHLSAERSCPLQKSRPAERGLSSKRIHYAGKVHSGDRGHHAKKERQHSAKKENTEKKFCSGESVAFQYSYTHEESNPGENTCSVEEGHHSMLQGFLVEKPSSGSMPTVLVPEYMTNTPEEESNIGDNEFSVEEGHHSMEQGAHVEKPLGYMPTVPVQEHMKNAPESRIGSGTSQVAQVPQQNVAGALTTNQHMQAANMRMGVELKMPEILKACLVEDWDLINKQRLLFQLPAEKNVDHILENYMVFVKSQRKSDNSEYSVDELVYGIRDYFNKMLGIQLLYQFEKPQYAEILLAYPDIPMSQIYGAPHLLRLFVNTGTALAHPSFNMHSLFFKVQPYAWFP